MVVVELVNGDSEEIEIRNCCLTDPIEYDKESECFKIYARKGDYLYPKDFIKCIKHKKF